MVKPAKTILKILNSRLIDRPYMKQSAAQYQFTVEKAGEPASHKVSCVCASTTERTGTGSGRELLKTVQGRPLLTLTHRTLHSCASSSPSTKDDLLIAILRNVLKICPNNSRQRAELLRKGSIHQREERRGTPVLLSAGMVIVMLPQILFLACFFAARLVSHECVDYS